MRDTKAFPGSLWTEKTKKTNRYSGVGEGKRMEKKRNMLPGSCGDRRTASRVYHAIPLKVSFLNGGGPIKCI